MNLRDTISAMMCKEVTIEEAQNIVNTQFGAVSAFLRQQPKHYYPFFSEKRHALRLQWNEENKKRPSHLPRIDWEEYLLDAEASSHREEIKKHQR